jgi:hypothetical protein
MHAQTHHASRAAGENARSSNQQEMNQYEKGKLQIDGKMMMMSEIRAGCNRDDS